MCEGVLRLRSTESARTNLGCIERGALATRVASQRVEQDALSALISLVAHLVVYSFSRASLVYYSTAPEVNTGHLGSSPSLALSRLAANPSLPRLDFLT